MMTRVTDFINSWRFFLLPALVVLFVSASFLSIAFLANKRVADAQIVNFYSTACTGGWDDVENVSGAPEVTEKSGEFNRENSAYLANKISPITCGGFSGDLPPETYHTRVMVRFSWGQENKPTEPISLEEDSESINDNSVIISTSTSTSTSTTTSNLSSIIDTENHDNEVGSTTATTTENTPVIDIISTSTDGTNVSTSQESEANASSSESKDTTDGEVLPLEIVPQSEEPPKEVQPTVEVAPTPKEEVKTQSTIVPEPEPISFWQSLLPAYAYAESTLGSTTENSTQEAISSSSPSEDKNEHILNEDILQAPAVISSSTETQLTDNEDKASLEAGAKFMVQYSLDGENWQILGYVTTVDSDVRLEFPKSVLATMEDISRVKVAITPLQQFDTITPVYLDAVWLEVSYAPQGELGVHSISSIVPTIVPIDEMVSEATTTADTGSSTTFAIITKEDFVKSVQSVHGIDERYSIVQIYNTATSSEMWVFDMEKKMIHRIGFLDAKIGLLPFGVKDGMIFWFNYTGEKIFTYDLRTAGMLHEMLLVSNLPENTEYKLTFPFTDWLVIFRGNQFYFYSQKTGEVFEDENTDSAGLVFDYFPFTETLDYERIQAIGGTFIDQTQLKESVISGTEP